VRDRDIEIDRRRKAARFFQTGFRQSVLTNAARTGNRFGRVVASLENGDEDSDALPHGPTVYHSVDFVVLLVFAERFALVDWLQLLISYRISPTPLRLVRTTEQVGSA
jgi:hypothetical protein